MPLKFKKIYADDPNRPGRRIVVGTQKTQGGKVTYISKGPVKKEKPTMSNFLASLFKPAIDRRVDEEVSKAAKDVGISYDPKTRTATFPPGSFKREPMTREEIEKYQKLSDKARRTEEKKPSRFGDLGMPEIKPFVFDQGLMGSGTDIKQQIDKLFSPNNLTLKNLRFNSGR